MLNNLSDKDLSTLLEEVKLELLSYINSRIRLFKLSSFEKLGISASIMGYGLIVAIVAGFILFFSLFGLAFAIGQMLNNQAAGFGIMALFSLLVLIGVLLSGKGIKRFILNKTIIFIRKVDKADEE